MELSDVKAERAQPQMRARIIDYCQGIQEGRKSQGDTGERLTVGHSWILAATLPRLTLTRVLIRQHCVPSLSHVLSRAKDS